VDREYFIFIRVFISFVFKSVNLSILQKTITKTSIRNVLYQNRSPQAGKREN
jgi:hypothetical protein